MGSWERDLVTGQLMWSHRARSAPPRPTLRYLLGVVDDLVIASGEYGLRALDRSSGIELHLIRFFGTTNHPDDGSQREPGGDAQPERSFDGGVHFDFPLFDGPADCESPVGFASPDRSGFAFVTRC